MERRVLEPLPRRSYFFTIVYAGKLGYNPDGSPCWRGEMPIRLAFAYALIAPMMLAIGVLIALTRRGGKRKRR